MNIMGLGLDFKGNPLFKTVDEHTLAKRLIGSLGRNADNIRTLGRTTAESVSFRLEVERVSIDPGDPRLAGWAYLVNSQDPQYDQIVNILKPLADQRAMADPNEPLLFNGEPPDEWYDWLHDNYYGLELDGKKVPHYILIIGSPEQVPFRFQSILDTVANVGRADFETLDDLKQYVQKIIRIETAEKPVVHRKACLFAPDAGLPDPTYFSREYMVNPMADHIKDTFNLDTTVLTGEEATKTNLLEAFGNTNPALVYTASHGLGATDEDFGFQKRYNGAICCQHVGPLTLDALFSADDIPMDQPFLEGAVFFQFACFGYGTPAESDYAHWYDGVPEKYTDSDFVASLPKRLLAHPRGPAAYIGHLDTAWLHGFADAETPHIFDRWHTRIAPFVNAVNKLLQVQPSGLALEAMNKRYSVCNALITNTYDRERRGKLKWNEAREARFLDNWISRGDAQNYMVFGDPAARLRIPTP
jgi:hypothetical protein